jgi:hypothetical protein
MPTDVGHLTGKPILQPMEAHDMATTTRTGAFVRHTTYANAYDLAVATELEAVEHFEADPAWESITPAEAAELDRMARDPQVHHIGSRFVGDRINVRREVIRDEWIVALHQVMGVSHA